MSDKVSDEKEDNKLLSEKDDFDISTLLNLITRNRSFIANFTLISTIFSGLIAISSRRIWEGQFQIVVENKNNNSQFSGDISRLAELAGVGSNRKRNTTLQTQVGILSSPKLLMDVYNFVKEEKIKKGFNSFSNNDFNTWRKNSFKILIQKKTSILDIVYKDSNQELIVPVLNKIAKSYQDYSGSKRLRELELGREFFEEQISIFKDKSIESLSLAQEFVIDQDMAILNTDKIDKDIPNFISIEAIRSSSANEIRSINFQLDKLNSLKDDESLVYILRTITEIVEDGLAEEIDMIDKEIVVLSVLKEKIINSSNDSDQILFLTNGVKALEESNLVLELNKINSELEFSKFIFTENDTGIKSLEEKRLKLTNLLRKTAIKYIDSTIEKQKSSRPKLIRLLKSQAKSFLEARKLSAEVRLKAAERPKGVLIKYRELTDSAYRDKLTLDKLEQEYRILLLEQAKNQDPWELITKPNLNPYPVAPYRKLILIQGLLIGFIISTLLAYIYERRKNLIYSSLEIKNILKIPLFSEFSIIKFEENKLFESLTLIKKNVNNKESDFAFLYIGEVNNKLKNKLNSKINKLFEKEKTIITSSFTDAINYSQIIFLTFEGLTKYDDIYDLKNQITIYEKSLIGFIFVKDYPKDEKQIDLIEVSIINLRNLILDTKIIVLNEINKFNFAKITEKFKYYFSLVKKSKK